MLVLAPGGTNTSGLDCGSLLLFGLVMMYNDS